MCKLESSQNEKGRDQSADSLKPYTTASLALLIEFVSQYTRPLFLLAKFQHFIK